MSAEAILSAKNSVNFRAVEPCWGAYSAPQIPIAGGDEELAAASPNSIPVVGSSASIFDTCLSSSPLMLSVVTSGMG